MVCKIILPFKCPFRDAPAGRQQGLQVLPPTVIQTKHATREWEVKGWGGLDCCVICFLKDTKWEAEETATSYLARFMIVI